MTDGGLSILPLFISLEPAAGESLMSFLVRASEANVLGRLPNILAIAGISNARVEYIPFTGLQHAGALARLLDVPDDVILMRMHSALEEGAGEYISWYGTRLPRRWIEARATRFSPMSLGAGGHHQAVWSIKALTYCPATMELLISACSYCGREATWATSKSATRCSGCGHPFTDCPTKAVPAHLQTDARRVADLVSPDAVVRADAVQQLPPPFNSWEPGDAFHAAAELGYVFSNPRPPEGCNRWKSMGRGSFHDYSVHELVAGYRFICEWPASLEAHLARLVESRSGKQSLMGSMGKYFGQHGASSPLGKLLRQQTPVLLRKIDAPIRNNQFREAVLLRSEGICMATEIADELAMTKKVVSRLSLSPVCCVAKSSVENGVVLYRRVDVENAVRLWRQALTFDQAARELGTPTYCTEALLDAGLLAEITDSDVLLLSEGVRLISRASLNGLARRLEELPFAQDERTDAIPLLTALTGILHPTSWTNAIDSILNGHLKLAGRRQRTTSILSGLLIADHAFEKLKATDEAMPMPEVTVSGKEAAELIGVNDTLVSGAVRLGLIQARKTRRRIEVPLSEVRRYRVEIIGADEVARRTGVRAQEFSAAMRSKGFKPLGQAYNIYFWRRADAESLYRSQL